MDAKRELRLCSRCVEWRPVDAFRRRRRGSDHRHHQCDDCAAAYQRQRRARNRGAAMDRAVVLLRRYRDCPRVLARLTEGRFRAFGGADQFFATFREQFDAARAAGRHHVAFRYLAAVLGLLPTTEPMDEDDETRLMSDDELATECGADLLTALVEFGYGEADAQELSGWLMERV